MRPEPYVSVQGARVVMPVTDEPHCAPTRAFSASPLSAGYPDASRLYGDYLAGREEAMQLFPHNPWEERAFRKAAERTLAFQRDRQTLVDVLAEQNERWQADEATQEQIERLGDEGSVAVVTGQQLGLFSGPLYTLYKALTAVRLAERLERELERAVIPIFWLADEDHDFAEIRSTTFAYNGDARTVTYDDGRPPEANRGPVGRIVLEEEALSDVFETLEGVISPSPFQGEAIAIAREAYIAGRSMRDAFALLLRRMTAGTGLVILSADDPRLKASVAPILRKELENGSTTHAALVSQTERVESVGYHAQVDPSPLNLFVFEEGERRALRSEGEEVVVQGGHQSMTQEEAVAWLDRSPEDGSPNVVLRPVMQDALLPTVAYVAGPGETAYSAQLREVYEQFGVPMPVIYPRLSMTVVEPGIEKVLNRYQLDIECVRDDLPALHRRLALDGEGPNLDAAFSAAERDMNAVLDALRDPVVETDASLERALEAGKARIEKALSRLEKKTVRVRKRQHQDIFDRLARANAALWPDRKLQERALSPLQLVARHGPNVFQRLVAAPPLDSSKHWIVRQGSRTRK